VISDGVGFLPPQAGLPAQAGASDGEEGRVPACAGREGNEPIVSSSDPGSKEFQRVSEVTSQSEPQKITPKQIEAIKRLAEKRGISGDFSFLNEISFDTASRIIRAMQRENFDPEELNFYQG